MKKADRQRQENRVNDALIYAQQIMGIRGKYELTVIYDWGFEGDAAVDQEGVTQVTTTCAITNAHWQYMKAKIRWLMPIVVGISDNRLLATAVHELVHVLLNPLDSFHIFPGDDPRANDATKANEFTTESVTRALLCAAGKPYPGAFEWLD